MSITNLAAGVIVALIVFFGLQWLLPMLGLGSIPTILLGLVALVVGFVVFKRGVDL